MKMMSVYSLADDKYVKTKLLTKKKGPLDSYKFTTVPSLECFKKTPVPEVLLRFRATPDTLVELAARIVKQLPLPVAHQWTNLEVIKWIENLGFKEYKNTFHANFINGHTLIYLDASALVAMNITKMCDIKKITKEIEHLYGIDMIRFVRSISLPVRYPFTHYQHYRSNTGTKYLNTNAIELFRKMQLIRPPPTYHEHWNILKKWLKHQQATDTELFGNAIKKTLYKNKRLPIVEPKLIRKRRSALACKCLQPPCTCGITEKSYRKSWRHSYLEKKRPTTDKDLLLNITDDDLCVLQKNINYDHKNCLPICTCGWKSREIALSTPLTILQSHFVKKYLVFNSDVVDVLNYKTDGESIKLSADPRKNSAQRLIEQRRSTIKKDRYQSIYSIHLEESSSGLSQN